MDNFPYLAARADDRGRAERGRFRYLGDAMAFVKALVGMECNNCMWTIHNTETSRLCSRVRWENGEVVHVV